jgi:hypothetical protein
VGQTPPWRVPVTHDHLSARGAITPDGTIVMHTRDHSSKGPDVARCVPVLLREIPGNVRVIWDGASMHRAHPIKDVVTKGGATRMHLERVPGSAPELHPQKSVPHRRQHWWVAVCEACVTFHDVNNVRRKPPER